MHASLLRVRASPSLLPPPLARDRPESKYSDAGKTSLRLPLDKCPRWPVYVGVGGCGRGPSVLLGCWEPWDSAMVTTPCKILHRGEIGVVYVKIGWGGPGAERRQKSHMGAHVPQCVCICGILHHPCTIEQKKCTHQHHFRTENGHATAARAFLVGLSGLSGGCVESNGYRKK